MVTDSPQKKFFTSEFFLLTYDKRHKNLAINKNFVRIVNGRSLLAKQKTSSFGNKRIPRVWFLGHIFWGERGRKIGVTVRVQRIVKFCSDFH